MNLQGNAHAIFNGSFYYQEAGRSRVIRYNLRQERKSGQLEVPNTVNNTDTGGPLYTTKYNYFDFNVDENGLWIISGLPFSNNTMVTKLGTAQLSQLEIQYSWNISVNHRKVGEMFIVCGVLYAIDSGTERNTKIRFALDLYQSKLLESTLTFTNPFRKTTAVAYNARSKELFTWDMGNQLTYPIRYNSMGSDAVSGERGEGDMHTAELQSTGFEIDRGDGEGRM